MFTFWVIETLVKISKSHPEGHFESGKTQWNLSDLIVSPEYTPVTSVYTSLFYYSIHHTLHSVTLNLWADTFFRLMSSWTLFLLHEIKILLVLRCHVVFYFIEMYTFLLFYAILLCFLFVCFLYLAYFWTAATKELLNFCGKVYLNKLEDLVLFQWSPRCWVCCLPEQSPGQVAGYLGRDRDSWRAAPTKNQWCSQAH